MRPSDKLEASLAVVAAGIRLHQLIDALSPLDTILSGDELDPVAHRLGDSVQAVVVNLDELAAVLAPKAAPTVPAQPTTPEGSENGDTDTV